MRFVQKLQYLAFFNLNFQSLEVVSRYRDPQLQATENMVFTLFPAGLLMTYTPGSVGSNTRKQGRHIVIRHGREYKHTLATLLQEVPVLPSQWLLCMQAPRAWSNFMATCYLTVIEVNTKHVWCSSVNSNIYCFCHFITLQFFAKSLRL